MNASRVLACPALREADDLRGERTVQGIRIICGTCDASSLRDTAPVCATCGGDEIVRRP